MAVMRGLQGGRVGASTRWPRCEEARAAGCYGEGRPRVEAAGQGQVWVALPQSCSGGYSHLVCYLALPPRPTRSNARPSPARQPAPGAQP